MEAEERRHDHEVSESTEAETEATKNGVARSPTFNSITL
jgi:hypothetical protein